MLNYLKNLFTSETRSKSLDITDLTVKTTDYPEFFYGPTESGVSVDPSNIMSNPAVAHAVGIISNFAGSIPCTLYERLPRGRQAAKNKSAYWLLAHQPAPYYPIKQLITGAVKNALIWGNSYIHISRNSNFEPVKLTLIPSNLVSVEVHAEMLVYSVTTNGEPLKVPDFNMIHIRGRYPSEDGIMGLALFSILAESLGLGLSLQKHAAGFFANALTPDQYIVIPVGWGDDKEKRMEIQKNWKEKYLGMANRGNIPVLYAGMELKQLQQTNNVASQFIEARNFDLIAVANAVGIDSVFLGTLQNVSYASLEIQQLQLLNMTVKPWLINIEQELRAKLLSTEEQRSESHYFEFDIENTLRMDSKTKIETLNSERANGNISGSEWREMMNLPVDPSMPEFYIPNGVRLLDEVNLSIEERKQTLEERKKAAEQPQPQDNSN